MFPRLKFASVLAGALAFMVAGPIARSIIAPASVGTVAPLWFIILATAWVQSHPLVGERGVGADLGLGGKTGLGVGGLARGRLVQAGCPVAPRSAPCSRHLDLALLPDRGPAVHGDA